jgi:hypothetical protein
VSPGNKKAGERRLIDMNQMPRQLRGPWTPQEKADGDPWVDTFLINENARYKQRISYDRIDRIVEWAVIQQKRDASGWRTVAVYDTCHGKGVHKHLYDSAGQRFDEVRLREVNSYGDLEKGLDEALSQMTDTHWVENERRSDRGY